MAGQGESDSHSMTLSNPEARHLEGIHPQYMSQNAPNSEAALARFFAGEAIYGDDFTVDQISQWFADEAEAYADLGAKNQESYRYRYHAMNHLHGYRLLPRGRRFPRCMGFGSAYGDELIPVLNRVDSVTVVDPSDSFARTELGGKPARWVKPDPSGTLPFDDRSFDLITCFGVLHHIPNVSHVIHEFRRVLSPGGLALVREPIVSMGDWRRPRGGLTARERGLPLQPFRDAIIQSGLTIQSFRLIGFGPLLGFLRKFNHNPYNSSALTWIDRALAEASAWNYRYHATRGGFIERLRPTAVFTILERPAQS